jgi:hypothetical protein
MDKLELYRQSIQALLTEYVATPISNGAIESHRIFAQETLEASRWS